MTPFLYTAFQLLDRKEVMTDTMFEITNTCTCVTYNEDKGDFEESPECWGDCWDCALDDFADTVHNLIDNNIGDEWRIEGFPVWHGTVDGVFEARTHHELIERITPSRTEWRLRYRVVGNTLECVLSHHDAPMGGAMKVVPVCTES